MTGQKSSVFRFYEELNDFLPLSRKKKDFTYSFYGKPTVKDCIEAIGIPHPEVDLILVDGSSVSFDYHLQGGERISVYPVFESFDISPAIRLRPKALRKTRFICDVHLGRLARQLRMLGFDVYYRSDLSDPEIIDRAKQETRIIITRDRGLLKHKKVNRGYWVRSTVVRQQLSEICQRFDLINQFRPFTRCMSCNGVLKAIAKAAVSDKIPPRIKNSNETFYECNQCHKVYWKGSHYSNMQRKVKQLVNQTYTGINGG